MHQLQSAIVLADRGIILRSCLPSQSTRAMKTFDYVIIGAGSAGCVLANRLSEDGKSTVAVLEAGPSDWHPFIHIPHT